ADHDEIRCEPIGDGSHRGGVDHVDRHALAQHRHAGIAGRAHNFVDHRRAGKPPRERVLAATAPENQDARAHDYAARGRTMVWSRAGPTPTKLTGTRVNSSMKR